MEDPVPKIDELPRRRVIYLLPNLFTTMALFAGFFAIISAIKGDFVAAAVAVFIAMVLDGLDGRVARMTNTQSAFGVQYDSLADIVSFGVAPALVVFLWALEGIEGRWGMLGAFVYMLSAAIRLARFNAQVETADKRFFTGLASPAAAAVLMGMVWVLETRDVDVAPLTGWIWVLIVTIGLLMVSSFPYYSFKTLSPRLKVSFFSIPIMVLVFVLAMRDFAMTVWLLFTAYAFSAPLWVLWRRGVRLFVRS